MELVTCIAGQIVDYSVEPIKRQVDYVIHCKSNLEKQKIELHDLTDARGTTGRNIDEAKKKGGRILEEVEESSQTSSQKMWRSACLDCHRCQQFKR